jgi:acetolactate synthase I/II/III large subunit
MKGYEALAKAFAGENVSALFGLMGDGNMYWMAAMATQPGIRVVHARHESAAVAMADGWSRMSGDIGVCSVTCGPGLTQIGTSLTASARHETPIVVFAGDTPLTARFHLQAFEQRAFVESTGSIYLHSTSVDNLVQDVQLAFFRARTERKPVVLGVPYDLQEREFTWDLEYTPSSDLVPAAAVVAPDPNGISDVVRRLGRAERPVILAGRGVVAAEAQVELEQLAERTGAVLATSLRAKGLFDGNPRNLGVAGAFSADAARALLTEADLVVGFGARMGYFTTEAGYLFPDADLVQIQVNPAGWIDGQRVADIALTADAKLGAQAILDALPASDAVRGFTLEEIAAARVPFPTPPPGSPGELDTNAVMVAINDEVPADWQIVIGAGHFWNFAVDWLSGRRPERYEYTYDFGVIGQGLPTAMGVAVADPNRPVALIEGDGSLIMNIQELESLARHQIPLLVLCINDGAYGAEVHKIRSKGLSADEAIFGRPDLGAVARAFGAVAETITEIEQLRKAITAFKAHPAPTVLDIHVSPDVICRQYQRLYFGRAS